MRGSAKTFRDELHINAKIIMMKNMITIKVTMFNIKMRLQTY